MRRLAAPTVLLACVASLFAAGPANAKLRLPAGANAAPELPAGVVVAELPPLDSATGQRTGGPVLSSARAATKRAVIQDGEHPFWATVNICDTTASPNALGVRTSVPGNGSDERIWARYTAQWWSGAAQEWKTVGGTGVTDWIHIGSADMSARQAGWTFRFVQPPSGTTYVMRGVVEFEWRDEVGSARRARKAHRAQRVAVVRQRTLLTETGMQGVQGGDPAGTSKAMCLIW
ncbi:MAG TPA: hypothetical protein VK486_03555 [Thermoleophilaceae bacterium]|nr:hypothetical protein [Thermoleophilaceae bacterium]